MKVTCDINKDFSTYRWALRVTYDKPMYINFLDAPQYMRDYQSVFQTKVKMELNEKKKNMIEKELQLLLEKYRKAGKLFFDDEVDLKPVGEFPKLLPNGQFVIHFLQITREKEKLKIEQNMANSISSCKALKS